jgi:putative solute:sodium symporter small subunit
MEGAPRAPAQPADEARRRAYWTENQRMIAILLVIWFIAGYAHPPFARALNNTEILTGFPLGYYLASQLSLAIFVVLIFFYAWYMNSVLDKKYGFEEEEFGVEEVEPPVETQR